MENYRLSSVDVTNTIIKDLKGKGLIIPKKPDYDHVEVTFTRDLGVLSPEEIMEKYNMFVNLYAYAGVLFAAASSELSEVKRNLATQEAYYYTLSSAKTDTGRKMERDISKGVLEAQQELTIAEHKYNMVKELKDSYEKEMVLLSRQITVLQSER